MPTCIDNMVPIYLIRRQHVESPTGTYFYNSLHFSIKINRLVEGAHHKVIGMTSNINKYTYLYIYIYIYI